MIFRSRLVGSLLLPGAPVAGGFALYALQGQNDFLALSWSFVCAGLLMMAHAWLSREVER